MIQNLKSDYSEMLIPLLTDLGYPNQEPLNLKNRIQTFLSNEKSFLYGYFEEGKLLGFGSLSMFPLIHEDGYLGRVSALAVKENSRGKGIGKRLMDYMERIASSYGCKRIELTSGVHRESNAHEFYIRIGYEKYAGARFVKSLVK